jgi:hypothetical protein
MKMQSSFLAAAAVFVVGHASLNAAIIFTESLGTIATTTAIATHETANGFDNDLLAFSGTGELRNTSASSGYGGASGSANIFLTDDVSSNLKIAGISSVGYTVGSIGVSFGAFKNTTASDMTTLILEYSADGSTWTSIGIPAQPTGSGTATWRSVSIANTGIPAVASLSLRWTNTDAIAQFRLDDITLSGTPTPVPEPAAATLLGALGALALLCRRRA